MARAAQAITDASNFQVSVCTIGIGDDATADVVFNDFKFFDEKLFSRKFDNFHHVNFSYFSKQQQWFLPGKYCSFVTNSEVASALDDDENRNACEFEFELFEEVPHQKELLDKIGF